MKRFVSVIISIILIASSIVTPSAYSWNDNDVMTVDEAVSEYELLHGEEVETNRYYFLMPNGSNGELGDDETKDSYGRYTIDWYKDGATNTAGIYWWGSGIADPTAWMGYLPSGVDKNDPNIFYADVPVAVPAIVWNNGVDGGTDTTLDIYYKACNTVNIGCQYYGVGENANYPDGTDNFDNMIYVIDPDNISINELSLKETCGGEWYYYYGYGCYGFTENGSVADCLRCDHYDAEGNHIFMDIEPTEPTQPPTQAPTELPTGVVKSIKMRPITLRQYIDGVWKNSGTDTEYFHYTLPGYEHPTYTITFSDGSTRSFNSKEFVYKGKEYEIEAHTDQSYENQWKLGNEYTMTFTADGVSVDVPITLYGIEKIVCEPITLIEETHGKWKSADDEGYADSIYFLYTPEKYMEYEVTFSDGRVVNSSGDWFEHGDGEYQFETETNQSYKKAWKPGNTYTMTATLNDITVEVPVTIRECPIKSVVYEPITLIKEQDGVWDYVYNEEIWAEDLEYFYYKPEKHLKCTVTFSDGTVKQYSGDSIEHNGEVFKMECITNQSFEQQWVPGNTYAMTVKLLNTSIRVPVTITKSQIKDVTFEPVTLTEGVHSTKEFAYNEETGEYDLEYDYYSLKDSLKYIVTLYDGSKIDCDYWFSYEDESVEYEEVWVEPGIETYQSYYNQWQPGNTYNIVVTLMDNDYVVPVKIEENPIQAISFEPLTLYEKVNGVLHCDVDLSDTEPYYIKYTPDDRTKYTITWNDGSTTECNTNRFYYNGTYVEMEYSSDQSYNNEWQPGNTYTMTATLMGVSTQFPVTIASSPIENIETIKIPDDYKNENGKWISPRAAMLRVHYTDGTYEDILVADVDIQKGNWIYLSKLERWVRGWASRLLDEEVETQYLFSLLGYELWVDYTPAPLPEIQVISIQNNGAELELTAVYKGVEQKKYKVLGMEINGGSSGEDYIAVGGKIITDDGNFGGSIYVNTVTGEFTLGLIIDGEEILSNTLYNCLWWDLQQKLDSMISVISTESGKEYNGEITSDNIDYLINLAITATNLNSDKTAYVDATRLRADSVKMAFYDTFGVVPDLSLSNRFDAKKKTYSPKIIKDYMPMTTYNRPFVFDYTEDGITVTIHSDQQTQQLIFNEDLQITGVSHGKVKEQCTGDADGDGNVTVTDAAMIQRHIAQITTIAYDRVECADTDKDGKITVLDATKIQKFIAQIIPSL